MVTGQGTLGLEQEAEVLISGDECYSLCGHSESEDSPLCPWARDSCPFIVITGSLITPP